MNILTTPAQFSKDANAMSGCLKNGLDSGLLDPLSSNQACALETPLPRDDFAELLLHQQEIAKLMRQASLPPLTLTERIVELIEGPWTPNRLDLPKKRNPEMSGNSSTPYRQPPINIADLTQRQERLRFMMQNEKCWPLTNWTNVFEYQVPIRNLPEGLEGLTILHLSDVHLLKHNEHTLREMEMVTNWVEKGDVKIDIILLSGDLITVAPDDLGLEGIRVLKRLSSVCSEAFMVYGNHDYHGHVPAFISCALEKAGFYDINNHSVRITINGDPLNIFGIDDSYFGSPKAPEGVPMNETNIILTHNLEAIRGNYPSAIDVIFSGHTHWGEVRGVGSRFMKFWGYCDNTNGHTKHWDMLTERTLSFVHPGLARYYLPYWPIMQPPGIALHTLRNMECHSVQLESAGLLRHWCSPSLV